MSAALTSVGGIVHVQLGTATRVRSRQEWVVDEQGARWLDEVRSLGVFGRAWIAGIFLFSAVRALIAWPALSKYGVDPVVFLVLDLVTAFPYGIGQAVTVKLLRTEGRPVRDAVPWGVMVGVMFMAPYVYIVAASGSMPLLAYLGVLAWMLVFGVLAVLRMRRQVLGGRRADQERNQDQDRTEPPPQGDDPVARHLPRSS